MQPNDEAVPEAAALPGKRTLDGLIHSCLTSEAKLAENESLGDVRNHHGSNGGSADNTAAVPTSGNIGMHQMSSEEKEYDHDNKRVKKHETWLSYHGPRRHPRIGDAYQVAQLPAPSTSTANTTSSP